MSTPGERIKIEREKLGWTQQRLADEISRIKKTRISRAAVAQWESGESKSQKPDNLFAAAEAMGLNPKYVLSGSGERYVADIEKNTDNKLVIRKQNFRQICEIVGGPDALARLTGIPSSTIQMYFSSSVPVRDEDVAKAAAVIQKEPAFMDAHHQWIEREIDSSGRWGNSAGSHLLPSSDSQKAFFGSESPQQQEGKKMPQLATVSRLKARPDVEIIRQYEAAGSMGFGLTLPDQPGVIENWSVTREWLDKNVRTHSGVKNLCIVTGFGPSMQPMFNPGDPLLVDTGVNSVIADGIYFFRVGNEGFVKQLQKIPTSTGIKYIAKSKNPDYDPFEITEDMDFAVLGRVIRGWCGTDF